MIASQNLHGGTKRPVADGNKVSKKVVKKAYPKRAFFAIKSQTLVNNQDIRESSFTTSASQSSNIVTPSKIPSKESKSSCFHIQ